MDVRMEEFAHLCHLCLCGVCVCVDGCRYDFVYVLKHFVRTCLEVCQTFEILQDTPRPLVVAGGLAAGQATGWNPQHLH